MMIKTNQKFKSLPDILTMYLSLQLKTNATDSMIYVYYQLKGIEVYYIGKY